MEQLRDAFQRYGLTREELLGDRYFRIKRIRALQAEGILDETLRWIPRESAVMAGAVA